MPDEDGLISKPDGEVGRRKRGYSLAAVLGWTQTKFKSTKDSVNSYIEDYLNHSLSASNQPQGYVDNLTQLVSASGYLDVCCAHTRHRFWPSTLVSWTSIGMVGPSAT